MVENAQLRQPPPPRAAWSVDRVKFTNKTEHPARVALRGVSIVGHSHSIAPTAKGSVTQAILGGSKQLPPAPPCPFSLDRDSTAVELGLSLKPLSAILAAHAIQTCSSGLGLRAQGTPRLAPPPYPRQRSTRRFSSLQLWHHTSSVTSHMCTCSSSGQKAATALSCCPERVSPTLLRDAP